jgi:type I restriction enzyme S subunit
MPGMPKAGLKTLNHRSDWKTERLKYLFKREKRPVMETDEVITAFRDGSVTLRTNRREDGFTFADLEIGYQGIDPGDLVVHAMDGFAGAIGVSDSRGKGSPVLSIATPITDAEPRFWAYYLRNLAVTGFIKSLAKGIRERSTDFRWIDVSNLLVNFPEIPTQRAIADFLDRETARIDSLIEKKQQLMELLGEKRSAVITASVTGQDPAFPDPSGSRDRKSDEGRERVSSLFQSIPEDWSRSRLKHLALGPKNGSWGREEGEDEFDAICVRVADFDWSRLTLKLDDPTRRSFKKQQIKNLQLRHGDIVIEKSGGGEKTPVGRVVLFDEDVEAVTSNFVARIRPHEGVWHRYFLYLLAAHYLSGYSHQFIKQNTGIQNLDDANLFSSEVWVPDLPIQRAIADLLDRETARIDSLIEKTGATIERLKEYRSALITSAVTGQIDVTTRPRQGNTDRQLDALKSEPQA